MVLSQSPLPLVSVNFERVIIYSRTPLMDLFIQKASLLRTNSLGIYPPAPMQLVLTIGNIFQNLPIMKDRSSTLDTNYREVRLKLMDPVPSLQFNSLHALVEQWRALRFQTSLLSRIRVPVLYCTAQYDAPNFDPNQHQHRCAVPIFFIPTFVSNAGFKEFLRSMELEINHYNYGQPNRENHTPSHPATIPQPQIMTETTKNGVRILDQIHEKEHHLSVPLPRKMIIKKGNFAWESKRSTHQPL